MLNGFTYAKNNKMHWYCSKRLKGCKAKVCLNEEETGIKYANMNHNHARPLYKKRADGLWWFWQIHGTKVLLEFIPTVRGGTTLVYKGYTYVHMSNKTRWYCSKIAARCKARLLTTPNGDLLDVIESRHNHPPPNLFRTKDGKVFKYILEFIPTNRGGTTLIYKGYTYAHMSSKTRWYCSKKAAGCKARLLTTPDGDLLAIIEYMHNHQPPNLFRTKDGKIFKC
ncbi:unnamed protein product, partial [Brenthis ino]